MADQLRCIISESLEPYPSLAYHILAPVVGIWVDLDTLPEAIKAGETHFTVGDERLGVNHVKQQLSFWLTKTCEVIAISCDQLQPVQSALILA